MKIAIKGHESRGNEVIQILESLGSINRCLLTGNSTITYYYIDYNSNNTIHCHNAYYINNCCKKYTLEEFEKEFPFKVGDTVVALADDKSHKIIALEYYNDKLCYRLDDRFHYQPRALKCYKEMKEERNITLTLDKAKEWYKKGGELKEIALQAFTEKELTKVNLPKTWEEFCENYPVQKGECWLSSMDTIHQAFYCSNRTFKNWIPSKKSAEAHLAMIQLEQLRNCWRQGWVQTSTDTGYRINRSLTGDYVVMSVGSCGYFLAFPTREMAEEFLECFRDLIEQAGDLI